ncbi:alpha-E domain-containing protein [Cohnella algarum]|nr:alpha-E domain-containing protein [Cohnella algarum]MBN2980777.1 alpha-E domain-containing protein [Cohnella algarum]
MYGEYRERDVLQFLTLDASQPNSLITCIAQARDNLRKVRERLPSELWNMLNSFYLWLRQISVEEIGAEPHRFFERIKEGLASYQGTAVSIVLRDECWSMMESGRSLERSENIVRLLQSVYQSAADSGASSYAYLLAVLKSVGGYEAYRRLAIEGVTLEEVSSFLLLEESFPRSVYFSLSSLESHLKEFRRKSEGGVAALERTIRMAGKARSELSWLEPKEISLQSLSDVLLRLQDGNRLLGESMAKTFFSPGREVIV